MDQSVLMYHLKNINDDSTTQQEKYTRRYRESFLSPCDNRSKLWWTKPQKLGNYKKGDADLDLKVLYGNDCNLIKNLSKISKLSNFPRLL